MSRVSNSVLIVLLAAFFLAGCGDFRRQAEEAQTRIATAEETAEVAVWAATENTERILVLEDRIEMLERKLDELLQESKEEEA